jgi:hypothetical protein
MKPLDMHPGPLPSERALIALWDVVEETRITRGERAAAELATHALQAIQAEQDAQQQKAGASC